MNNKSLLAGALLLSATAAKATTYSYQDLTPAVGNFSASAVGNGVVAAQWREDPFIFFADGRNVALSDGDFDAARIKSTNGSVFVGIGYIKDPAPSQHAVIWRNFELKPIKLTPLAYSNSRAYGYANGITVGAGLRNYDNQALLWTGHSPSTHRKITPVGYTGGESRAITGGRIFGWAVKGYTQPHAGIWTDAGATFKDLHRPEWVSSHAYGGTLVDAVGHAALSNEPSKAVRWLETGRVINLHPSAYFSSTAHVSRGGKQAGSGIPSKYEPKRALVWERNLPIDLHNTLPAHFTTSEAIAIEADGSVIGTATDFTGLYHVIRWSPVNA